jgi:O-acetyl-ADP-ribose deacetylase (regulator of RNase III)
LKKTIINKTLSLIQGDITERQVDAIVNAANSYLRHGGGVAGAIVQKGGAIIQEESNRIDFVPVGSVVVTTAGNLPCKSVIHAVGPQMGEGDEDAKLKDTIHSILQLASDKKFSSVSIPAISSGIFGFPKDRCAKILVSETQKFVKENQDTSVQLVEFCIYDDETYSHFEKEFGLIED